MGRLRSVRENWNEITETLKTDKQALQKFLGFSAKMYKLPFHDAALIYHQNPNATKVADLKTWNRLGRLVNKGESSIAVFGDGDKCRHYFDTSQTNGKREPAVWHLTNEVAEDLTESINKKYGKSCKTLAETIAAMSVDNIKSYLPDMQRNTEMMKLSDKDITEYQRSVVSATRYMVSARCELDSGMKIRGSLNLNAADICRDNKDFIRFCDLANKSAKDTLLELEREIIQILKQRREKKHERSELQRKPEIKPDGTDIIGNAIHRRPDRIGTPEKAGRTVGHDVAGVDENGVSVGGDGTHNDVQVANHSEGNRHNGAAPSGGTGQPLQKTESPSAGISGNSEMGERPPDVDREPADGGNLSASGIKAFPFAIGDTVEVEGRDFQIEKIDAEWGEITLRDLKLVIISRVMKTEDFTALYAPKNETPSLSVSAPEVIINNEPVTITDLPPLTEEKAIFEILRYDKALLAKREDIAEFFRNTEDLSARTDFIRNAYDSGEVNFYTRNINGGYEKTESGLKIWENRLDGERAKESVLSWNLVQSLIADMTEQDIYLDKLKIDTLFAEPVKTEQLTLFGEPEPALSREDEIIAEELLNIEHYKKVSIQEFFRGNPSIPDCAKALKDEIGKGIKDGSHPDVNMVMSDGRGMRIVLNEGDDINISWNNAAKRVAELIDRGAFLPEAGLEVKTDIIPQNVNDNILSYGGTDRDSILRICAQYQKGKPPEENAEFLKREMGDNTGRGLMSGNKRYAVWYDDKGIKIGEGNSVNTPKSVSLTWEQTALRIGELLEQGRFTEQDNLDLAWENEIKLCSDKLWRLNHDTNDEMDFFLPDELFKGGHPDSVAMISDYLRERETLESAIEGLAAYAEEFRKDPHNVSRFPHLNKPDELLDSLKDLRKEPLVFKAEKGFQTDGKLFITEDEITAVIKRGSGFQDGKFGIEKFFKEEHTPKEKEQFIKNAYGTGGSGWWGFDEWHDRKGLTYKRGLTLEPYDKVTLTWSNVVKRIERLVKDGEYINQADIDERIRHARYVLKNYAPSGYGNEYPIKRAAAVLNEYGLEIPRYKNDVQETPSVAPETNDTIININDVSEPEPAEKSPVEKLLEKAKAAGIPVESVESGVRSVELNPPEHNAPDITPQSDVPVTVTDNQQEKRIGSRAVFMDTRDESFIMVSYCDEGIDYSFYSPDLTLMESDVWETDEPPELKEAAARLLATSETALAQIGDADRFMDIADYNSELDNVEELQKLKASIIPVESKESGELSADVNPPEQNTPDITPHPTLQTPHAGIPVTYRFNENDTIIGGAKTKFKANIEAIQTLLKVESENRYATSEEQSVMAKYSGWGGIPQAFDRHNGEWSAEYAQLKNLLSEDEYKAARASTLTSFYTPPEVADGVYQALSQFGFEGGNVLEPSMGTGNFFSKMPEDMRGNSRLYGVELDSVSGRIAKMLNPDDNIQIKGFEETRFNNNSFDVVVGNIPFGDFGVVDKAYDKLNFNIHDYFAAKAVDKVKPGGVVALVTSKWTMDKQGEKVRRYLAERADLLGAVRLPNNTFKGNAGTEAVTDILFLKKRDVLTVQMPDWVHLSQTPDGIPCNRYFVDNPDMILGKMAWDERMKGKYGEDSKATTCLPDTEKPLSEQIKHAVSRIEGKIESHSLNNSTLNTPNSTLLNSTLPADPSVRNYTHTLVGGELYFRENEIMRKVAETGKTLDRMTGMHRVRLAAMAVIDAQADGYSDLELTALQADLNGIYDKFVKAYGNITDKANERCFRHDDDYNTLAALEIIDVEKKTVEKSEIFTKRTVNPEIEIMSVDTPQEALQVSMDKLGRVDIAYMARLAGGTPESVINDLSAGNHIFRNPAKIRDNDSFSGYEEASEYLSGNVREKLRIAKEYSELIDVRLERNVPALEKVQPKNIEASDIAVRIGTNWVDEETYDQFFSECAKGDMWRHPVRRNRLGEYKIEGKYQDRGIFATNTYGTSRMSSYHIFENLLNHRDIVVRDKVEIEGKATYVVNAKETKLAKEKARKMKEAFKNWIWKDIDRRGHYVEKYNNLFNSIRGREYDGSKQSFPGMNPSITLKDHQKNAVLRAKLGGNTLLAHCVGAGKSFEIVAAAMEKKRLGLINKACVVVPKHLTLQMASEWSRLYPNSKLLIARPEDFEKNNRQKFVARCVTGEYDAVIMSFTQFERIPMSFEYRKQFIENEIDEILEAMEDVDKDDRVSVKALERQNRKLNERLEKLLTTDNKDNSLCFEKLGFDYLAADEFHNYKNCFIATKMSNVAGVQTTAAQKSEDMLMKTQYLNEKYGYNNILTATGTPISNSMTELYTMKRYLRPDLLEQAQLHNFDDWAGAFGEVVSQLELKPAGDGFRMKNRFSKFTNIPELMQMYKEFADIQTSDMLDLPVPDINTNIR